MRILFTICGRAGSKGIKNKNISDFCGKPLPLYSLSAIDLYLKSVEDELEHDIVVSTDSPELIEIMTHNSMRRVSIINRSEELSGDVIGKIAVINDCLRQMEERNSYTYDLVVDLDITSPLRTLEDIMNVIDRHIDTDADVTTSVVPARRNPYFNQLMRTEKGYKKAIESSFTSRQQAPDIFDMNASIYAYKPEYLRSGKGVLEGYVECIEMYDTGILDLDHKNDYELMQVIAEYLFKTNIEFQRIYDNIVY